MAEVRRSKAEARQSKAEADTKVRESKAEVEVEKEKAKAAAAAAKAGTAAAVSQSKAEVRQSKAEAETRVREVKAEAAAAAVTSKAEAETKVREAEEKAETKVRESKAEAEAETTAAVNAALAKAAAEAKAAEEAKAAAEAEAAEEAKAAAALSKLCDIMVSYTQKNTKAASLAINIYSVLQEKGYKVWLDVKEDDKSEAAMEKAVTTSTFIIAILCDGQGVQGNAYFERKFCLKELRWAKEAGKFIQPVTTDEDKTRIVPLMHGGTYPDGTRFEGAPEDLSDLIKVDMVDLNMTDSEYFELGLKKIIRKARANGVEIDDHLNTPESPLKERISLSDV